MRQGVEDLGRLLVNNPSIHAHADSVAGCPAVDGIQQCGSTVQSSAATTEAVLFVIHSHLECNESKTVANAQALLNQIMRAVGREDE